MNIAFKKIPFDSIDRCKPIDDWLNQFSPNIQGAAIDLLLNLKFVTREVFSEWLKFTLNSLQTPRCAIYAVRKFGDEIKSIWDQDGKIVSRPGFSLGSEDLVQSIIAEVMKTHDKRFFDNPNLDRIKKEKIRDIVLLDDSVGSGQRLSCFIDLMMANKTFRSWWSLGWIKFHILSFSRSIEAETRIVKYIPGSNHRLRKFPKSDKIFFISRSVYEASDLRLRWGKNAQGIYDLCASQNEIPLHYRLGFGQAMANVIFYHSVPDNIPGNLWVQDAKWVPLFPGRSMPDWVRGVLEGRFEKTSLKPLIKPTEEMIRVLGLVKKGVRNIFSLAHLLEIDPRVMKKLLLQGKASGFLTDTNRITETGLHILHNEKISGPRPFNRSIYIPRILCVGQAPVQPSGLGALIQADSTVGSSTVEGEVGQISLEKTDAKTASPSLSIMPQLPSKPRMGHDTHGPKG